MKANFPGRCSCCDELFPEGTSIIFSESAGGWIIESHSEGAESGQVGQKPEKPQIICPNCFTARAANGACACY